MSVAPIPSPCINVCRLDDEAGLCLGCWRTVTEIAGWRAATPGEREAVMRLLPQRRADLLERRLSV